MFLTFVYKRDPDKIDPYKRDPDKRDPVTNRHKTPQPPPVHTPHSKLVNCYDQTLRT
jgi:hypothetical protein